MMRVTIEKGKIEIEADCPDRLKQCHVVAASLLEQMNDKEHKPKSIGFHEVYPVEASNNNES